MENAGRREHAVTGVFRTVERVSRRPFFFSLAIWMSAFIFRLILLVWSSPEIPVDGDAPSYLAIARSIAEGTGYSKNGVDPTAIRMPLYPLFLAGIFSIHGAGIWTVKFVQIILDSLTCLMVYFLAKKLIDLPHAVISGFITAFYLPCAYFSLFILSETLFCFLMTGSLLALAYSEGRSRRVAFSGCIMGLSVLARPNGIIVAFFVLLWLLLSGRNFRHGILYALMVVTCMAPWVARNAFVFHHFIPTYTTNGITFYNSYSIPAKGYGFNSLDGIPRNYYLLTNEAERNAYLLSRTFSYIREHPLAVIGSIPGKTVLLANPFNMKWIIPSFPVRYNFFWAAVFLFACLGCVKRFRWMATHLSLVLFPVLSLVFTASILYGSPRIRLPFDPLLAIFASVGIVWIWERRDRAAWFAGIAAAHGIVAAAVSLSRVTDILRRVLR